MKLLQKTIFTGFAPNLRPRDVVCALSYLLLPWKWSRFRNGDAPTAVETWLKDFFHVSSAVTFDSGRTALSAALRALDVGPGADVLVQAYTCLVVVNAVQAVGAHPIFVDTGNDFFMNPDDAERKITPRTKAMILQHTFGIPADTGRLLAFAKKHRLRVVEDAAHTIGGTDASGRLLGTLGDIGILSFGSDKAVSSVRGGAAITNISAWGERMRAIQKDLPPMKRRAVVQHLLHPPVFYLGKSLYRFGIGKMILWLAKTLSVTPRTISEKEKEGRSDPGYPAKFPNALAALALLQLSKVTVVNEHRKKIARFYSERLGLPLVHHCPYLRFPVIVSKPVELRTHAKKQGILLGNWYDQVVAPCRAGCPHIPYTQGACPHAEKDARGSVNLPTDERISFHDAERIIDCLRSYGI